MLEIKFLVSLIKLMILKFMDMDFLAMVKLKAAVLQLIIILLLVQVVKYNFQNLNMALADMQFKLFKFY
jgi:hypothetical protein